MNSVFGTNDRAAIIIVSRGSCLVIIVISIFNITLFYQLLLIVTIIAQG